MNQIKLMGVSMLLFVVITSCAQSKKEVMAENEALKSEIEKMSNPVLDKENENAKVSYAIGMQIGANFKQQGLDTIIDLNLLRKAIADAQTDSTEMTDAEVQETMQAFSQKMQAAQQAEANAAADINKAKGEAFLAENGKRPEVTTLPSGLQYEVLKEGNGPIPKANDRVSTHYTGTLLDGTKFDSSVDRGTPFEANAGSGLIQGWMEALQLMPVGSKWKLYVPSDLAYGPRGAGGSIGPNETLIFEMELLYIVTQ